MAIGYFMAGVGGATLAGVAFVIPLFGWDPDLRRLWVFAPASCGGLVYEDAA
jgi:hypothetical protein